MPTLKLFLDHMRNGNLKEVESLLDNHPSLVYWCRHSTLCAKGMSDNAACIFAVWGRIMTCLFEATQFVYEWKNIPSEGRTLSTMKSFLKRCSALGDVVGSTVVSPHFLTTLHHIEPDYVIEMLRTSNKLTDDPEILRRFSTEKNSFRRIYPYIHWEGLYKKKIKYADKAIPHIHMIPKEYMRHHIYCNKDYEKAMLEFIEFGAFVEVDSVLGEE